MDSPKCEICGRDTITVTDHITSPTNGAVVVKRFKTKCNKTDCNDGIRFIGYGKTRKLSMLDYGEKYDKDFNEIEQAKQLREGVK